MVAWYWALIAFIAGLIIGAVAMAIFINRAVGAGV